MPGHAYAHFPSRSGANGCSDFSGPRSGEDLSILFRLVLQVHLEAELTGDVYRLRGSSIGLLCSRQHLGDPAGEVKGILRQGVVDTVEDLATAAEAVAHSNRHAGATCVRFGAEDVCTVRRRRMVARRSA